MTKYIVNLEGGEKLKIDDSQLKLLTKLQELSYICFDFVNNDEIEDLTK